MQIINQYDQERLLAYNRNERHNNCIKVELFRDAGIFSFPEVSYFNYVWIDETRTLTCNDLDSFCSHYATQGIRGHRILIPAQATKNIELLRNNSRYHYARKLMITSYSKITKTDLLHSPLVHLVPVGIDNIGAFTDLYLRGFEAEGRCFNRVISNFRQLLLVEGMELFIVKYEMQPVGINVIFSKEHEYLLAGGAILPEFRNQHIHKISMGIRINSCLKDINCSGIFSWAYDGSVSLQNMLKIGMTIFEERMIYEFTG